MRTTEKKLLTVFILTVICPSIQAAEQPRLSNETLRELHRAHLERRGQQQSSTESTEATKTSANSTQDQQQATQIHEEYLCPITKEIMIDPVLDVTDGNSYERSAIELWLLGHNTSPLSRNPLSKNDLTPNLALRSMIHKQFPEVKEKYEKIHASKLSSAATASDQQPRMRSQSPTVSSSSSAASSAAASLTTEQQTTQSQVVPPTISNRRAPSEARNLLKRLELWSDKSTLRSGGWCSRNHHQMVVPDLTPSSDPMRRAMNYKCLACDLSGAAMNEVVDEKERAYEQHRMTHGVHSSYEMKANSSHCIFCRQSTEFLASRDRERKANRGQQYRMWTFSHNARHSLEGRQRYEREREKYIADGKRQRELRRQLWEQQQRQRLQQIRQEYRQKQQSRETAPSGELTITEDGILVWRSYNP